MGHTSDRYRHKLNHRSAVQEPDIIQRLREVMGAVFGVETESIGPDTTSTTIAEWDSVRHLQLMLALEEEFGVEFEMDELASLRSVAQLVERLSAHG